MLCYCEFPIATQQYIPAAAVHALRAKSLAILAQMHKPRPVKLAPRELIVHHKGLQMMRKEASMSGGQSVPVYMYIFYARAVAI